MSDSTAHRSQFALKPIEVFPLADQIPMRIALASSSPPWMNGLDDTGDWRRSRIANRGGWTIHNNQTVEIVWNGGKGADDLRIYARDVGARSCVVSQFGNGIVTWKLPFLFRLPPELSLRLRGPVNWHKDGIFPIEQILDVDSCRGPISMSWKVTKIGLPVRFEADEPLCIIYPESTSLVDQILPLFHDAATNLSFASDSVVSKADNATFTPLMTEAGRGFSFAEEGDVSNLSVVGPTASTLDNEFPRPTNSPGRAFVVETDFYDQTLALRAQFDRIASPPASADPVANLFNYQYSENGCQLLTASAERIFSADLLFSLLSRLRAWARLAVGATHASTPRVQVFVDRSYRHLARDDIRTSWHYLLSLTSGAKKVGEIDLLFNPSSVDERDTELAVGRLARIPLRFNELLVHDARQPYGVRPIKGSMNPAEGVVLLDGYLW